MREIAFIVPGRPRPKGSSTWIPKGGKAVPITDEKLVTWTGAVAIAAAEAMDGEPLLQGGIILIAVFEFSRPKSHYGTGRNAEKLKPSAPDDHTQKPDSSKLLRALEDAMTGIVYKDDAQICSHYIHKDWINKDAQDYTFVRVWEK